MALGFCMRRGGGISADQHPFLVHFYFIKNGNKNWSLWLTTILKSITYQFRLSLVTKSPYYKWTPALPNCRETGLTCQGFNTPPVSPVTVKKNVSAKTLPVKQFHLRTDKVWWLVEPMPMEWLSSASRPSFAGNTLYLNS